MMRIFIFIIFALSVIFGGLSMVYVVEKCGPKGLLFGKNAVTIAAMGFCDK